MGNVSKIKISEKLIKFNLKVMSVAVSFHCFVMQGHMSEYSMSFDIGLLCLNINSP